MRFIVINDTKLKIILSKEDVSGFEISPDDFDYSKTSTKHILWSVLDKAHIETGFDADRSKLYVQVFSSKSGGCEIYVSKIKDNNADSEQNDTKSINNYVYLVLKFDDLISLCKRIVKDKFKLDTVLYHDLNNSYILVFCLQKKLPSYYSNDIKYKIPEYLSEYGKINEMSDYSLNFFDEYFDIIAEGNAAEIISCITE